MKQNQISKSEETHLNTSYDSDDVLDEYISIEIPKTYLAKVKLSISLNISQDLQSSSESPLKKSNMSGLIKTQLDLPSELLKNKSKGDDSVIDLEMVESSKLKHVRRYDFSTDRNHKIDYKDMNSSTKNTHNLLDLVEKLKKKEGLNRIMAEEIILKELIGKNPHNSADHYLEISWATIYSNYLSCVKKNHGIPSIPPINNTILLDLKGKLIGNLKEGMQYVLVHKNIWDFLHILYGGGPPIINFQKKKLIKSKQPISAKLPINELKEAKEKKNSGFLQAIGLKNKSNSCFLNAGLQCLFSFEQLNEYFLSEGFLHLDYKRQKPPLFCSAYADSLKMLLNNHNFPINLQSLRHLLKPLLDTSEQQDIHEFIRVFLTQLQDELNPKNENISIIDKLFEGKTINQLQCKNCRFISSVNDLFLDLSLSIPNKKTNLNECLEKYFKDEEIIDSYLCQNCNIKCQATKKIYIQIEPKILVIHLKRFKYFPKKQKLFNLVQFPIENLSLKKFCDKNVENKNYCLKAYAIHLGKTDYGHYIAYGEREGKWFLFNDESVKEVSKSKLPQKDAYLLFYKRCV